MTDLFSLYFPIAEIRISAIVILGIGFISGFMSGLLGIGGGFISTPLLTLTGISPAVAVSTSALQIVGTSFSSILPRIKPKKIDFKLGFLLSFAGIFGSLVGILMFQSFSQYGNIDTIISFFYIVLMLFVSCLSFRSYFKKNKNTENKKIKITMFKAKFHTAGVECSVLIPLFLGFFTGILVVMMGVGGGFILVPAMVSIMKIKNDVAVGTSLLQILLITTLVVFFHIFKTGLLDVMLGTFLILGAAVGSQISSIISLKIGKKKVINLLLAILTLSVALKFSADIFLPEAQNNILIEKYYE